MQPKHLDRLNIDWEAGGNGLSWTRLSKKPMHLQQVGQAGQIQVDRQVCQGRPANPTDTGLDVLRKGPRLPGLIIASGVPTIIKDYCASWIKGESDQQTGEKPRFDWSWCTPWTTSHQKCQLGTPWHSKKLENGEICDRNWKPLFTNLSMYLQILTLISTNKRTYQQTKIWPNWNLALKYMQIWCWFFDFGSNRYSSKHSVQSWHVSDLFAWWFAQICFFSVFSVHINKLRRLTLSSFAHS